jgi:hypothetical protein
MKASIVDLRYKMKEILRALENNETVSILYHGKVKGTIVPNISRSGKPVTKHPFFSMNSEHEKTVLEELDELRGNRYDAL